MLKKLKEVNNQSFFTEPNSLFKFLLIFIHGDIFILLPLVFFLAISVFINAKFGIAMIGVYITLRYLGEMIYWIHQQFGPKKYRPYDWGFKNLNNEAIYILYQTFSLTMCVVGAVLVFYAVLYIS